MKYAVIALGGKQFIVEEGSQVHVDHQVSPEAKVLLYRDGKSLKIGAPYVEDVTLKLSVVRDYKVKTRVARFKSKSRYRRVRGHKQPMSVVSVDKLSLKRAKRAQKEEAK